MRKTCLFLGVMILFFMVFESNAFGGETTFTIRYLVPDKLLMLQAKITNLERIKDGEVFSSASISFAKSLGDGIIEISKRYSIISIVPITAELGWGSATSSLLIFVTKK